MTPLISVIIPVKDAGGYLRTAIDSIRNQSIGDIEIIVIDDHSRDDAVNRIEGLDPRIIIERNSGAGLVAALNHGLRRARGTWIARMDADDEALPSRFAEQLTISESYPELCILGAKVEIFSDAAAIGGGYAEYESWINSLTRPWLINRDIFIECPMPHPTLFCHRRVFDTLGSYRDLGWPEDYDLCLRAWHRRIPMLKPEPVLLRWRDHPNRLSRNDPRYSSDRFITLKAAFLRKLAQSPVTIWGAGRGGKRLFDALICHGVTVNAFIDVSAKRIGNLARGRPVLAPEDVAHIDPPVFVAVGTRGTKPKLRAYLTRHGWREARDYWFTA